MSDMKMYGILGKFNNLNPEMKALDPKKATKEPVYEEVQPRGSITEAVKSLEEKYMGFKAVEKAAKKGGAENPAAVAASIGRKKYGKKKFQKAAAAGKKLGEAAKPDFLDVDGDGNKKEPFKKAVKDKEVKEGRELKNKEEFDKHAKKGDYYKTSKGNKVTKTDSGVKHEKAYAGDDSDKDLDESKTFKTSTGGEVTKTATGIIHKGKKYGGEEEYPNHSGNTKDIMDRKSRHRIVDLGDPDDDDLDETIVKEKAVSKQQQKFMGMVHAVQKGKMKAPSEEIAKVAKGMTKKAAHDFAATKHKGLPTKVTEGKEAIRHHPIYTDKDAWNHYKKELDEQEMMDGVRNVQQELDEIAKLAGVPIACPKCSSAPCQCNEELASVNTETPLSHELSGTHCVQCNESPCSCSHEEELDELTAPPRAVPSGKKSTFDPSALKAPGSRPSTPMANTSRLNAPADDLEEDEMEEGNEFSGALAKAKATGAKDFEVGGKRYTVKEAQEKLDEQVSQLSIQADGVDAVRILQMLSGLKANDEEQQPVEPAANQNVGQQQPMGVAPEEELDEQHSNHNVINRGKRPVENLNTPREDYAAADITTMTGTGLDKKKTEIEFAPPIGDNPLQAKKKHGEIGEAALWKQYEAMLNEITK